MRWWPALQSSEQRTMLKVGQKITVPTACLNSSPSDYNMHDTLPSGAVISFRHCACTSPSMVPYKANPPLQRRNAIASLGLCSL